MIEYRMRQMFEGLTKEEMEKYSEMIEELIQIITKYSN